MSTPKCSPGWYAIASVVVVPVTAVICAVMGVLLLLSWPIMPFILYRSRKAELEGTEL